MGGRVDKWADIRGQACVCVCVCRYVSAWMGRKMGGYVYSWVGGGWREMDRGIGWVVG